MKASDIVSQLSVLLPQLTDKFTTDVGVFSVTRSGTNMTVVCSEQHGLEVGQAFAIVGSDVPIPISSLTRLGTVGTLVTSTSHDLTNAVAETIRITGATESEFNDTFTVTNIENRTTITFVMADSGATSATGSPILRDAESKLRDYNTIYNVDDVIDPVTFMFSHAVTGLPDPDGNFTLRIKPRISSGLNIERISAAYTESQLDSYWAFVVLGAANVSQSRLVESDALDNQQRNSSFRQQMIEPFTVFVFIPVEDEIAARHSRDEASDLLRPLLRSLLFSKLSTGLYADVLNPVQFVGHDAFSYDTSVYVHQYNFQQVAEIYEEDTVGPDLDVAFRNIDFSIFTDFGTQVEFMQGTPNLDDEPI
jgi:hypothetical protein